MIHARTFPRCPAAAVLLASALFFAPGAPAQTAETAALTGWFSVLWGDGRPGSGLETMMLYTLTDRSGQTTLLALDEERARAWGGVLALDRRYVEARGSWALAGSADGAAAVLDVTSVALLGPASAPADAETSGAPDGLAAALLVEGSRPWVSILCKFSDCADEPRDLAYFQGMYDDAEPGLDHYWRELSYDTVDIAGSSAHGWFTLPHPETTYNPTDTTGGTDLTRLANDCIAAADAQVDFSLYSGINMMFNTNFDNGYAWGGSRFMFLDGVMKSWSVTWEPPWGYASVTVIAHEMGHGFGLPHSSGTYGQTYDNVWDVMSDTWSNCGRSSDPVYGCLGQHTIAYHKDRLGWIPAAWKHAGAGSAVIAMDPLALASGSHYRMAQIPIEGSGTHFYTVEVRDWTGYDVKLPGKAVVIHEVDTTRSRPAQVVDVDGNGKTGDAGAMWGPGETFVDAEHGISVTVVSATPTGFRVAINPEVAVLPALHLLLTGP